MNGSKTMDYKETMLNGSDWGRDELISKYAEYDFPYINIGAEVDVTGLHAFAKENGISFYCAMIYCAISAVPWIHFTHVVRTIKKSGKDSVPRITWGRYDADAAGRLMMPVSVQVHHALMDGYHVGMFYKNLEKELGRF